MNAKADLIFKRVELLVTDRLQFRQCKDHIQTLT